MTKNSWYEFVLIVALTAALDSSLPESFDTFIYYAQGMAVWAWIRGDLQWLQRLRSPST